MTDEEIMERLKAGDLQQASWLFERYHKKIYNYLAQLSDRESAEDLTQNVFLRIIKYKHSYTSGKRFQPWLYQIARNVFSDHYQSSVMKNKFLAVEKIADVPDNDDNSQEYEKEKLLMDCIQKLPTEQQELLVLTKFQQMKYEEVAEIMNTSVANIKVRVHRAIAKLREHYFSIEQN